MFVATPGHGVHAPSRPTVNFFAADKTFAETYEEASTQRGFEHGVLVKFAEIEDIGRQEGFDFDEVKVGYPHGHGETNHLEFWRYDLGNHRYTSVGALQFATVVRLATPENKRLQTIRVRQDAVVAWW